MSEFVPKKHHLREALLFCFHMKKTAAASRRLLVDAYGEHALSQSQCEKWFVRFKSGDFDTEDKARPGQPKKFEDDELKALINEDSTQTQEELAKALSVDHTTVGRRLKALGFTRKLSNWVPQKLSSEDVEKRLNICKTLLKKQNRNGFLHRIITGGEKWIQYDSPKRKAVCQPSTSQPKQDIHGEKVLLTIWWDQLGVIYYEVLRSNQTANRHRGQLERLYRELFAKRPQYVDSKEGVFLLHDNDRQFDNATTEMIARLGWELLPHPPYSADISPSDHHLFRSMLDEMAGHRFTSVDEIEHWIDAFLDSNPTSFFENGIQNLPELWENVVTANGQYFE